MKKLLSLAASLAICVSGITAMTSSAKIVGDSEYAWFIIMGEELPECYKPYDKLNDYWDFTSNELVYQSTKSGEFMLVQSDSYNNYLLSRLVINESLRKFYTNSPEKATELAEYILKEHPELTVYTDDSKVCYIDVNTDEYQNLSLDEKIEIALNVKKNFGVKSEYCALASLSNPKNIRFAGDTDLNGEITISDAAQIMSFVTNKKQSPLSEMSQIVGDIYNTGDGINNMDALQIQRILANVE